MASDVPPAERQQTAPAPRGNLSLDCTLPELQQRSRNRSYESPLRHHTRNHTAPRRVKETLNARSEYTNSQDDGVAEHRINQYLIKQEIGRGSFGAVHLAVDQYGQEYAVKEFSKSRLRKRAQSHVLRNPRGPRRSGIIGPGGGLNSPLHRHPSGHGDETGGNSLYLIQEEIAIMKKLHHNNLVGLIEVLDDPTEDSLYMVMEMCKKGVIMKVGLEEEADPYGDESCRCWFRDLILGIEYLHAQGIVHRDIKPDNCLLTNDDVLKVVDFGVSEMFEKHSEMYTAKSAGSPAFLPPELCVVKHGDVSGRAADIWSMGVTLYCLRYGRIPFEKDGILDLYEAIRNDEVNIDGETDEDFKDLMGKILQKDPAKRIQMSELRCHPWVTKRGTDPLLSAEENTAELVGPPTEEEVNAAITTNMGRLLVVLKAVKRFKRLIEPVEEGPMESILGTEAESHFVQPPLSMESANKSDTKAAPRSPASIKEGSSMKSQDISASPTALEPADSSKTGSVSSIERKRGSIPRFSSIKGDESRRGSQPNISMTSKPCSPSPQISRADTPSKQSFSDGTRGHARDPLEEEHLYLFIGPSTLVGAPVDDSNKLEYSGRDAIIRSATVPGGSYAVDPMVMYEPPHRAAMDDVPIVSESPGASDIDIYETAYREEVERIRTRSLDTQGPAPKVYLTRRVEGKTSSLGALLQQATREGLLGSKAKEPSAQAEETSLPTTSDEGTSVTQQPSSYSGAGHSSGSNLSSAESPTTTRKPSLSTRTTSLSTTTTATSATNATITTSVGEKSQTGLRGLLDRVRKDRKGSD